MLSHGKQEKIPPIPLATHSFGIGKEKSLVLPVYMYATRRGKLQNKERLNSSGLYLTVTTKHVTLCVIKLRPFSPDYAFSTSSATILVYRERATNMLETMQSNREPALEWKQ